MSKIQELYDDIKAGKYPKITDAHRARIQIHNEQGSDRGFRGDCATEVNALYLVCAVGNDYVMLRERLRNLSVPDVNPRSRGQVLQGITVLKDDCRGRDRRAEIQDALRRVDDGADFDEEVVPIINSALGIEPTPTKEREPVLSAAETMREEESTDHNLSYEQRMSILDKELQVLQQAAKTWEIILEARREERALGVERASALTVASEAVLDAARVPPPPPNVVVHQTPTLTPPVLVPPPVSGTGSR